MRRLAARLRRAGRVHVGLAMVFAVVLGYMGCTEEKAITAGDDDLPVVALVFPVPPQGNPLDVSDSTTLTATARDASGIDFVEFFRRGENDTAAVRIGRVESADSTVDGVNYYSVNWRTGAISNGTTVQVFARATDAGGNIGRSGSIDVRILNVTELGPPSSCFIPIPAAGTIADNFTFDAGCTTDDIDPLSELKVRWDFNGDGTWEIDTTDNRSPLEIVSWNYGAPGLYTVRMEAFNTYFEGGRIATGEVDVTNVGGTPRPQSEVIEIPGGTYTIGAVDTAGSDADERPVHTVRVSTYKIEKNEVTNTLYSAYLNKARDSLAIVFFPPDVVRDTLGHTIIDFNQSQMFFAVDEDSFSVKPGFEDHPVTGVNWYGATSYAIFFGLRLPTEREWEIAAKGTFGDWRFPWGTELDSTRANYILSGDPFDNGTTPVGFFDGSLRDTFQTNPGASPFGLNDVAGNVKEWVRDWYEPVYPVSPLPNYSGPASGTMKNVRGGSYLSTPLGIRTTNREATDPRTTSPLIGFRTAFTVFDNP